MALIDEVKAEVIKRHTGAVQSMAEAPVGELKNTRRRRKPEDMTKEEREAWLQKKREEEEARYLKDRAKEAKEAQPEVKKRVRKVKAEPAPQPAPKPAPKPTPKPMPKQVQRRRKGPIIAQPLEPLYLLKIPGLPKGDCIAICYAKGADVSCS